MSQEAVEASAAQLHLALQGRNERVGCAESLTGGELAAWLSSTPGASATFTGAVVSYAGEVKRDVLGVTAERVVSSDCAEQMATGVRQLLGVEVGIADLFENPVLRTFSEHVVHALLAQYDPEELARLDALLDGDPSLG